MTIGSNVRSSRGRRNSCRPIPQESAVCQIDRVVTRRVTRRYLEGGELGYGVEGGFDKVLYRAVLEEALHLVLRYAQSMPIESATRVTW